MLAFDVGAVDFAKGNGLVPVVAQESHTGAVLMVAWTDRDALERSLQTGLMHYHSRRRGLWQKGESSGHVQRLVSLSLDCDGDTILAQVQQSGPACHTGAPTCFGDVEPRPIDRLNRVVADRAGTADSNETVSYTHRLLADRNLRLKKLGEEAAELVLACADGDRERAIEECADLLYHALVALRAIGASLTDVEAELAARARERAV